MKRMCAMCRECKDISEFYFDKYNNAYRGYCKKCQRLYIKEYMRIYRERKRALKAQEVKKYG